jgi:4-amino-4-deoxy-L-arabinose transferase-like glycosyltransferase
MKRILKASFNWLTSHWREIISVVIIGTIAVTALSLELSTIVDGQNKFESITLKNLEQRPDPLNRTVNLPYFLPAYYLGKVLDNPLQGARVTSVIIGLLATICLFFILKMWFNKRVATVGSLLFITSSWLLNITHQATPNSLLILAPLLILTPLAWFFKTKKHKFLAFILFTIGLGFAAYSPLMFWVVIVVFATILFKERKQLLNIKTKQIIIGSLIYFILLLPLFISLTVHPGQIREFLGLPLYYPTISGYFGNLLDTISMLLIYSRPFPELHLGRLPMLDFFSSAMMIMGIIYFIGKLKTRRAIILFSCIFILLLIIPLSPTYQLDAIVLISFVYALIIAGIVYLLNIWFDFFPRNPWARLIGVILMVVLIGMSSYYNLNRYFVAWPNSEATKAVYMIELKK